MAKGETTWSSDSAKVKKFNFEPLPPGNYELKLDTSKIEIRKAQREDAFPRVAMAFTAVGTGKDGGKDRLVFHDFYLRIEPNEKGNVLVEMPHQLAALAKALGSKANLGTVEFNGERILDPKKVKEWLENRDGEVVNGRLRIEPDQNGEKRNRIQSFEEAENTGSDEEETDSDSSEDEEEFERAVSKKTAGKRR